MRRWMLILLMSAGVALAAENPPPSSFKEGTGVLLSEATKQAIGLTLAEVEERPLVRTLALSAQIYRSAHESGQDRVEVAGFAYASALVEVGAAAQLKPGMAIRIARNPETAGRILRLDRSMAGQGGRVEILLQLDDPEKAWRVGDFIRAELTLDAGTAVTLIPQSSILKTAYGDFVYVQNGQAYLRSEVTLGAREGGVVDVLDGLYAGDQVVVRPVETLYLIELRATKGGGHSH